VTPSNDFIVSPHSACEGLFIATCGSFHGFKFLPVIGKYVVEMLSGELTPLLQQRWAWDRERPSPDTNVKWSRRELREFGSSESSSH
jgi:glycine/D-amino acid oxidase-like deaminating enzyme